MYTFLWLKPTVCTVDIQPANSLTAPAVGSGALSRHELNTESAACIFTTLRPKLRMRLF